MNPNGMRQYDDRLVSGPPVVNAPGEQMGQPRSDQGEQAKALQVLTMAQRTAEEHIDSARREAEHIRAEARSAAGQIVNEAQSHAEALRDEAEKTLTRARVAADKVAHDAEAYAADTERNADNVLAEAQARAEEIVHAAQANAYEIKQRAEQTYEDVVGGLTSKRQALQQQIESLEHFDHEYRARLTTFMQQQMRALWVGQPQVEPEFEDSAPVAGELLPAQRREQGEPQHAQYDDDEDED